MDEPTVADVIAFEALPEETKKIAEVFFQMRAEDIADKMSEVMQESYERGYNAGYRAGRRKAEAHGSGY